VSWGTSTDGAVPKDAIEVEQPQLSDVVEAEQREQLDVATQAAKALARVVGRPGDDVRVSMTGHANPDHAPRQGWANEMITVTVSAHPSAD
jgi:aldehyde:ferredoxin oxidoreductase